MTGRLIINLLSLDNMRCIFKECTWHRVCVCVHTRKIRLNMKFTNFFLVGIIIPKKNNQYENIFLQYPFGFVLVCEYMSLNMFCIQRVLQRHCVSLDFLLITVLTSGLFKMPSAFQWLTFINTNFTPVENEHILWG